MEAGYVFDFHGGLIHWHVPPDRSMSALPDSRSLWDVLWKNREILGGVAHTHPFTGVAVPSQTDLTTWAAVEQGLGQRLVWPIVTFSQVGYFTWEGPGRLTYEVMEHRRFRIPRHFIEQLRDLSR
jgi:hypothetical protein